MLEAYWPTRPKKSRKHTNQHFWGNRLHCKVSSIRRVPYEGVVYDLHVPAGEAFQLPGGLVHNCRPPRNRDPKQSELQSCNPWLWGQLAALPNLKIVVALGRYASLALCPDIKPARIRGMARLVDGKVHFFILHPAAVLHNPNMMEELVTSFTRLSTLL